MLEGAESCYAGCLAHHNFGVFGDGAALEKQRVQGLDTEISQWIYEHKRAREKTAPQTFVLKAETARLAHNYAEETETEGKPADELGKESPRHSESGGGCKTAG